MNAKEKGRSVVTTKVFEKDEYICEYGGHLITSKQAREAEHEHEQGGTFMFYFEHKGRKLCYSIMITLSLCDCSFMPYNVCFIVWMLLKNQGRVKIQSSFNW